MPDRAIIFEDCVNHVVAAYAKHKETPNGRNVIIGVTPDDDAPEPTPEQIEIIAGFDFFTALDNLKASRPEVPDEKPGQAATDLCEEAMIMFVLTLRRAGVKIARPRIISVQGVGFNVVPAEHVDAYLSAYDALGCIAGTFQQVRDANGFTPLDAEGLR